VLAGIAEELDRPLGFRTVPEVRVQMEELGPWDGDRAAFDAVTASPRGDSGEGLVLSTWRQLIDLGSMQDGDDNLRATARAAVARVSPATYAGLGGEPTTVTVTGDRGSWTLPVEVAPDLVDGVVWVPAKNTGRGVLAELASPGSRVTVKGAQL
jgi:NADH-quinone oxidoreductase subunit G